jgi:hypothetical protein
MQIAPIQNSLDRAYALIFDIDITSDTFTASVLIIEFDFTYMNGSVQTNNLTLLTSGSSK